MYKIILRKVKNKGVSNGNVGNAENFFYVDKRAYVITQYMIALQEVKKLIKKV